MDIDRYITANEPSWIRLNELTHQARTSRKKMSAAEIDELLALYQQTSSQLSYARGEYRDVALNARLTMAVASTRSVIYGTQARGTRSFFEFFSIRFPTAVWFARKSIVIAALVTILPAVAMGVWLANDQEALDAAAPEAARAAYVDEEFEAYYSSEAAGAFSTRVLVNNIYVSILAFSSGILLCIPTVFVLAFNGANVGAAGGLFHAVGQGPKFWGLILPHGLLEVSSVIIAGAAGLRLGWSVISPGDRTRAEAVTEEGSRSTVIVLGLMMAFIVAGLIEGFVTPSSLPTAMRVGIGAAVFGVFVVYIVTRGMIGERMGLTGLLREEIPDAETLLTRGA